MIAEVLSALTLFAVGGLGYFLIQQLTELNTFCWTIKQITSDHDRRIRDLELRVGELEKRE